MSHVDPVVSTEETVDQTATATTAAAATEPSVDTETPAQSDDSAKIEELRALIAARKEAVAAKKASLANDATGKEEQEQQLRAAKSKNQAAAKESAELEKKKAEVEPEYERLNENADMRETAIKLAEDIEQNEADLAAEEEKATGVEATCKDTTAAYSEESKRSTEFITAVQKRIDELQHAFTTKIAVTAQIDPEGYEAFDHLQDVSVAVMARGKQLSTLTKILREQQCLIAINTSRKENVNTDCESQNAALLRQKDEQIRDAVFRFQDERARLHHDIEDMQRINKEQANALKSGDVLKKVERGGTIGVKTTQSTREADEQAQLNADVEALNEKLALAKADIAAALEGIRNATKVKSDLIKEDKTLQHRIQWDKTHQDAELAGIHQSTQMAILSKGRQERENEKLADHIKVLTRQVKRLKDATETIENRTKPLPVE